MCFGIKGHLLVDSKSYAHFDPKYETLKYTRVNAHLKEYFQLNNICHRGNGQALTMHRKINPIHY
ncbi:hypothetical protein J2736_000241 [Paenibacillus qinlingensis]|uniref:Uncharacterized protein n=1 Tax=Paenibacillus qinlingensis TaxID=1837343 RepID=A0ABU1NNS8_9BACL|nr:hypothetical protein [Paenibacillus qinlingensis]